MFEKDVNRGGGDEDDESEVSVDSTDLIRGLANECLWAVLSSPNFESLFAKACDDVDTSPIFIEGFKTQIRELIFKQYILEIKEEMLEHDERMLLRLDFSKLFALKEKGKTLRLSNDPIDRNHATFGGAISHILDKMKKAA